MGLAVLRRPSYDRTDVLMAKFLNFLSDGRVKGQREIQRGTGASPTTVNKYLKVLTQEGKVSEVNIGKRRRYQITQQGLDEFKRLTEEVERKNRLQSQMVYLTIPSESETKPIFFQVGIGSKQGTPDPLSLKTQEGIKQRLGGFVPLVERLQGYTKAEPLEVRVVFGSPPLKLKRERT